MPNTGRIDYDNALADGTGASVTDFIPDDEPIIVLRARDLCAVEAVRWYVKKARSLRAGAQPHLCPSEELLNSMAGHADKMERYAMENGGFKRATLAGEAE